MPTSMNMLGDQKSMRENLEFHAWIGASMNVPILAIF